MLSLMISCEKSLDQSRQGQYSNDVSIAEATVAASNIHWSPEIKSILSSKSSRRKILWDGGQEKWYFSIVDVIAGAF